MLHSLSMTMRDKVPTSWQREICCSCYHEAFVLCDHYRGGKKNKILVFYCNSPITRSYFMCGEMHGMLPRVSSITNAREHSAWVCRNVRGNGGCFDPRVGVFVCLTPMSPDVPRGWVPKTVSSPEWAESVAVSRPWEWPERGIWEAWSTTLVERYQRSCVRPVNSELWPCEPVPWRCRICVYGRWQGLDQTVSALWVKGELGEFSRQPCELRESSASSHDTWTPQIML